MTDLCRPGPLVIVAMRIPPLFLAALVALCWNPLRAELLADGDAIPLFDGRSFAGWVMTDGSPVNDGWEVVDGMIHLKPVAGPRPGSIRTTAAFENFELEFEWRVAAGGNSGVKYRLREADSPFGRHFFGCEYQLLDDAGHKNGRTPEKTAGSLYGLYPADPAAKQLRPEGEFNQGKIVCDDGRIEHWLNGRKVVEAVIGSDEWIARRQQSKLADVAGLAEGPGVILLQEHLSEAWFRNLRLTRLGKGNAADRPHDAAADLVATAHAESLALRERRLRQTIAKESVWPGGTWGDNLWTLAALTLNEKTDQANARLLEAASRYIDGYQSDGDLATPSPEQQAGAPWTFFSITDYVRTLCLFHADSVHFPGRLTAATEAAMKEALWLWTSQTSRVADYGMDDLLLLLGTENHDLNTRPVHYLVTSLLEHDPAYRDRPLADGHTTAVHAAAHQAFFREWPRQRATAGIWIEVGSTTYQKYTWPALFNLHELAPDPVIRDRFGLLLDLALIEEAQLSVDGRRGGGRSRAGYTVGGFEPMKSLLYGEGGGSSHSRVIEASRYLPPAEAVLLRKRAVAITEPFTIRNRVLGKIDDGSGDGHRIAADSALVNYAYRTPHSLLGSTLQNPSLNYSGISRQNRACGMLCDTPGARVPSQIHPVAEHTGGGRSQHSFWSVQHENVLLLQRIAQIGKGHPGSYHTGRLGIRFAGDDLTLTEADGWILASNGTAFAAVRFLDGGHTWDEDGRLANPARYTGPNDTGRILLHAGDVTTHGSFDAFCEAVRSCRLEVTPEAVSYSFGGNQIVMSRYDAHAPGSFALPLVNGQPIDLHPQAVYESPFLNGAYGGDRVTITVGGLSRTLDFQAPPDLPQRP